MSGGAGGCSETTASVTIHDTAGSVPAARSAKNVLMSAVARASFAGFDRICWKKISGLNAPTADGIDPSATE